MQQPASTARERYRQLAALFDECVELEPSQREQRLQALAAESAELAARLREMLAADADADPLLRDGSAIDSPGAAQALVEQLIPGQEQTDPWPRLQALARRRLQPPERVGPYRLQERIGIGGMGEVWLGQRDDGAYEQRVAVKLVAHTGRSLAERFERERQILARLQHHSIARLYDGGQTPEGLPYLVMEYVEGLPITEHVSATRLPLRAVLALLIEVCEAVDHAHRLMVVHRDLKPSNVLVDGEGQIKLLDFGIAKLLDEGAPALTLGEDQPMTPLYAAPEQIRGDAVSAASDVYALGAILYELLTGRLPNARAGLPLTELAEAVARETVLPPSRQLEQPAAEQPAVTPPWAAATLRGDLDLLVLTALHADPARRYPSAAALGEDLRRWLAGLPLRARPDHFGYRAGKFVRRHRMPLAVLGLLLLALAAGFSLALAELRRHGDMLAQQQQALQAEREARALALRALQASAGSAATEALGALLDEGRRSLAQQPLLLAELELAVAVHLLERDQAADATALLAGVAGRLAEIAPGPGSGALWQRLAQAWRRAGDHRAAQEALARATAAVAQDRAGWP